MPAPETEDVGMCVNTGLDRSPLGLRSSGQSFTKKKRGFFAFYFSSRRLWAVPRAHTVTSRFTVGSAFAYPFVIVLCSPSMLPLP